MPTQFPLTLAAAKDAEKSQWAIGDALVKECGPPGHRNHRCPHTNGEAASGSQRESFVEFFYA